MQGCIGSIPVGAPGSPSSIGAAPDHVFSPPAPHGVKNADCQIALGQLALSGVADLAFLTGVGAAVEAGVGLAGVAAAAVSEILPTAAPVAFEIAGEEGTLVTPAVGRTVGAYAWAGATAAVGARSGGEWLKNIAIGFVPGVRTYYAGQNVKKACGW
jgi:hypothetical protein